ncbi:hypothetical protein Ccrd_017272 [Cynara cardunculus var. scolymus]|uniref:Uncharacterized protein n=1 Tax=Cynara cardunculus var. scolymus TaxID=59895 RepID=A0A103Y8F0_CYNCS|nr:hypothetical protein Ccrd_017272 [Cynara cardunculus var. scolymus]
MLSTTCSPLLHSAQNPRSPVSHALHYSTLPKTHALPSPMLSTTPLCPKPTLSPDSHSEAWKEWGQKKKLTKEKFDPPPVDFSEMDLAQIRCSTYSDIAMKWSKISRTGATEVKFMGVDVSTIMFTLEKGQDTLELKDFILSQPEAYEMKIADRLFRKPGDPPFDDVFTEVHINDEGHAHPLIEWVLLLQCFIKTSGLVL